MATGKLLTGVLAAAGGAALGILLAPDKGTETRRKISSKRDEYMDKLDEQFTKLQDGVQQKLEKFLDNLNEGMQKNRKAQEGRSPSQTTTDFNTADDLYSSSKSTEQGFGGSTGPAL